MTSFVQAATSGVCMCTRAPKALALQHIASKRPHTPLARRELLLATCAAHYSTDYI